MYEGERAFLDFYSKNKISPVSQDISDLKQHFTRREALYRHLGISPHLLKNTSILEVGPGSGHNALFTMNCKPAKYTLVDGNPVGVAETQKRLAEYAPRLSPDTELNIIHSILEEFSSEDKFDVIFCEAMLPLQKNPELMLRKLASHAVQGGIIVITCMDNVSVLSDFIRRLMGQAIANPELSAIEQADALVPFFNQHFKNLHGMNRPVNDWILDNVIQPFMGELFSIPNAIDAVSDIADAYGVSPHLFIDWRWYKDILDADFGMNDLVIKQWWENVHNFIDYQCHCDTVAPELNQLLYKKATVFIDTVIAFQNNRSPANLAPSLVHLEALRDVLIKYPNAEKIRKCIDDALVGLNEIAKGNLNPDCGEFAKLFGRGQQYLSFIVR